MTTSSEGRVQGTALQSTLFARTADDRTRIAVVALGQISDEEHAEFTKDLADLVDLYFPTITEGENTK